MEINKRTAVIDYFGVRREALIDGGEVKVGDYVFAQGGFVVEVIPGGEARDILENWREVFLRLEERDRRLSSSAAGTGGGDPGISRILDEMEGGRPVSEDEILALLSIDGEENLEMLYDAANRLRQRVHGNSCCVHGIIEFSNICGNDCAYCGIRKENNGLRRYRMEPDEVVGVASRAVNNMGFRALVLQSGEDGYYTTGVLGGIVRRIRERCGVLIILSIGERSLADYEELYKAGARGVLMRFETSSPEIYARMHATLAYGKRLEILGGLKSIGYIIATGSLIGLPGQGPEDLRGDILLAASLKTDMYSFGPLLAHPHTPLAGTPEVDLHKGMKVIAVTRLIDPNGTILVTSAMEQLFGRRGMKMALESGGNSMMINLTPSEYRRHYSIYPGKGDGSGGIREEVDTKLELLHSLGRGPLDIGMKTGVMQ